MNPSQHPLPTVHRLRASVLYTFKILLPQVILTMVAFSTLWLSPECGERLGLAITVPLAVAVYGGWVRLCCFEVCLLLSEVFGVVALTTSLNGLQGGRFKPAC